MSLVLITRYCYSALDCAIQVNRYLIKYGSNNLGRTSIDRIPRFLQIPRRNILLVGKFFIFKDAGQFHPISWDKYDNEV